MIFINQYLHPYLIACTDNSKTLCTEAVSISLHREKERLGNWKHTLPVQLIQLKVSTPVEPNDADAVQREPTVEHRLELSPPTGGHDDVVGLHKDAG